MDLNLDGSCANYLVAAAWRWWFYIKRTFAASLQESMESVTMSVMSALLEVALY